MNDFNWEEIYTHAGDWYGAMLRKHLGHILNPGKHRRDFLTDRKYFNSISGIQSTLRVVYCGVPQCSVLWPILSLIYINELHRAFGTEPTRLVADDFYVKNILFSLLPGVRRRISHYLNAALIISWKLIMIIMCCFPHKKTSQCLGDFSALTSMGFPYSERHVSNS